MGSARTAWRYEGWGQGRVWPLLTGERAHYELAAGNGVIPLIETYEKFAACWADAAGAGVGRSGQAGTQYAAGAASGFGGAAGVGACGVFEAAAIGGGWQGL